MEYRDRIFVCIGRVFVCIFKYMFFIVSCSVPQW